MIKGEGRRGIMFSTSLGDVREMVEPELKEIRRLPQSGRDS